MTLTKSPLVSEVKAKALARGGQPSQLIGLVTGVKWVAVWLVFRWGQVILLSVLGELIFKQPLVLMSSMK